MKKTLPILLLLSIIIIGASFTILNEEESPSINGITKGIGDYKFDKEGDLIRPEGYRKWIYIGTPLTPNELNPPEAAFPEFHNVYIHPDDFEHWEKTGKFRDGTIIIKELVTVGSTAAVSGKGYFMGDFAGLEATIKDSKQFPKEPGNWAYFSFGHSFPYTKTAKVFPTGACNSCHEASAADDFVFTQYYPVLSQAKGGSVPAKSGSQGAISPEDLNTDGMKEAMRERFNADDVPPTEKVKLLAWLDKGNYKDWHSESSVHPSFGPHDDVKVFYNSILEASLKAGNKSHPAGAASVKEQHKDGKHYGYSVAIKVEKKSKSGDGWYWFETLDKTNKTEVAFAGVGELACSGCHNRPGNKDLILSGYPLK